MTSHFNTPPRSQKITFVKTDLYSLFLYLNCKTSQSHSQILETIWDFYWFSLLWHRKFLMWYMGLMEVITHRLSDKYLTRKVSQNPLWPLLEKVTCLQTESIIFHGLLFKYLSTLVSVNWRKNIWLMLLTVVVLDLSIPQ